MRKPVLVSVVSTVPPKIAWSFELYLYLELTVPQVSNCCPLGRLVTVTDINVDLRYFQHCLILRDCVNKILANRIHVYLKVYRCTIEISMGQLLYI